MHKREVDRLAQMGQSLELSYQIQGNVLGRERKIGDTAGLRSELAQLYSQLSSRNRRRLRRLLGLSVISAFAEVITLGALLPFLTLLADRSQISETIITRAVVLMLSEIDPLNIMIGATLLVIIAALSAACVRALLLWYGQRFVQDVGHELTMTVLNRSLHRPYVYHASQNSSETVAAVNKVQLLVLRALFPLLQVATNLVTIALIFAALVIVHPVLALGASVSLCLAYGVAVILARPILRKNSQTIANTQAGRIQTVQEGMGGIRDVLLDRSQGYFLKRFEKLDTAFRDAQAQNTIIAGVPRFAIEAFAIIGVVFLAFYFSRQDGGLNSAIPLLGVLALGIQRILPALQSLFANWALIRGSHRMLSDVLDMIADQDPLGSENVGQLMRDPEFTFSKEIGLRNVGFAYDVAGPKILTDVNLTIEKGSRVGFVGLTGSGKSTLADIVMGLLDPTSGEILIDSQSLEGGNKRAWQDRVSHVSQDVYLIDASLTQNIAFGIEDADIDAARLKDAIHKSSLADFVANQPDGLNTHIGERGVRLSGGQKQRIGIARAIYKNAELIVLDEATSALDEKTEAKVMDAISALDRSVTIIIIAHRANSIAWCDQIYAVENGSVAVLDRA